MHNNSPCIFHVDLDCFFAAVEEVEQPLLRGKPLAVSGRSRRGIITTANYPARQFGIHSAMPVFEALQRCPHLLLVPSHFPLYRAYSEKVQKILASYTRKMEIVSIDEAYLDLSRRPEPPMELAQCMQAEIASQTQLSVSIGISYNKFLAKIASDWKKPHGIFQIRQEDAEEFLHKLPLQKIHGLGRHGLAKLNALGIFDMSALYKLSLKQLQTLFGKQGSILYDRIRGKDERNVLPSPARKSIGIERTFEADILSRSALLPILEQFCDDLSDELSERSIYAKGVQIKVKMASFRTFTRSMTTHTPIQSAQDLYHYGQELLLPVEVNEPVRLLGITATHLVEDSDLQMNLWNL